MEEKTIVFNSPAEVKKALVKEGVRWVFGLVGITVVARAVLVGGAKAIDAAFR